MLLGDCRLVNGRACRIMLRGKTRVMLTRGDRIVNVRLCRVVIGRTCGTMHLAFGRVMLRGDSGIVLNGILRLVECGTDGAMDRVLGARGGEREQREY